MAIASSTQPSLDIRRAAALPRGLAIAHPSLSIARAEGARVWDVDGQASISISRPASAS